MNKAKALYNKAVLHGYKLTEDDHKVMANTRYGALMSKKDFKDQPKSIFSEYSKFLKEIATKPLTRTQLAREVADAVEDTFDLHYSQNHPEVKVDTVKHFASSLINAAQTNPKDKESLFDAIEDSSNPYDVIIRLSFFTK